MSDRPSLANVDWPELIRQSRTGQSEPLGEICRRLHDYLTLTAERMLDPETRAKVGVSDVVQQSLLEAHTDFEQFSGHGEAELRSWLEQILRHNLIDAARRFRQSQQRDSSREVSIDAYGRQMALPGKGSSPSSVFRRGEQDEQLMRSIENLPQRRRAVVEMRHRDGLSYGEIALALGVTETAARKLWSRAIEQLRSELTEGHDDRV